MNEMTGDLQRPKMRDPMGGVNHTDRIRSYYPHTYSLGKKYQPLLDTTRKLEIELSEKKKKNGIDFLGCSDSNNGIIRGGSDPHIVEHFICAVLDSMVPLDEQTTGLTEPSTAVRDIRGLHYNYNMFINPPPSMSKEQAQKAVEFITKSLAAWNGVDELDIQEIIEKIK